MTKSANKPGRPGLLPWLRDGLHWRANILLTRLRTAARPYLGIRNQMWLRVIMDRETDRFVRSLPYQSMSAVEISGTKWQNVGFRSYRSADYPKYDVCQEPLGTDLYDVVIAEQVLEHVLWPYRAVKNVWQMLAPGGVFVCTTPFMIPIHEHPVDCSRWTELGLRNLLAEGGFRPADITTGSWGNAACVRANFHSWRRWIWWKHSLKNDPRFPVAVWAFARKTGRG